MRFVWACRVTVVSPDVGSVVRASIMAKRIGAELAILVKHRPEPGKVAVIEVIGKVENQTCVMIDDMVDSAGTLVAAADELAERSAKEIYACAIHPVLSDDAVRRVQDSCIKELTVTDTIPISPERMIPKSPFSQSRNYALMRFCESIPMIREYHVWYMGEVGRVKMIKLRHSERSRRIPEVQRRCSCTFIGQLSMRA